ncbi:hypothetical protein B0J13DRAFT_110517 [Dactylonectria estremocensis]|uniref:Uncharacterized protein n=1 Tax=Dactylonectria estremocensis TaxID=1079267 RepID=A0A9P9FDV8_9HYPO|nr:hypothetical protein B0J13DRAFT_110517 [Dactylonectria estremocensis]
MQVSVQALGCCWMLLGYCWFAGGYCWLCWDSARGCQQSIAGCNAPREEEVGGESDWALKCLVPLLGLGHSAGSLLEGSFGLWIGRASSSGTRAGAELITGKPPPALGFGRWWAGKLACLDERRPGGGGAEKKRGPRKKKRWRDGCEGWRDGGLEGMREAFSGERGHVSVLSAFDCGNGLSWNGERVRRRKQGGRSVNAGGRVAVAASLLLVACVTVRDIRVIVGGDGSQGVRESNPKEGTSSTERMICDGCWGA